MQQRRCSTVRRRKKRKKRTTVFPRKRCTYTGLLLLTACFGVTTARAQPFPARVDLGSITSEEGILLNGIDIGDYAGQHVAGIGDINDDGFDDVAVSATDAQPNGHASGEIYVLLGGNAELSPVFDLEDLDGTNGFQINGIERWDRAGDVVDGAGDVNGDGIDDLILGARAGDPNGAGSGEAYVIFGRSLFPATIELADLDGSIGFQINGAGEGDRFGSGVAGVGDFDGDGFDDIAIGATESFDYANDGPGSVYLIFGRESFPRYLELDLDGSNGVRIKGVNSGDSAGWVVSGAGDVNGDGLDDLILGAPDALRNGVMSGEAYLVFGRTNDMPPSIELDDINGSNGGVRLEGIDWSDVAGRDVRAAGDFNQDGFDDVLIGASFADPNGLSSGETYLVFGRAAFPESIRLADLNGTDGTRFNGVADDDNSGVSVAGVGDFNGDGFGDLLIGANRADPNGSNSGASYLVFGGTESADTVELSSLDGSNGLVYEGATEDDVSGQSVDTAGDFNGNGVDDIVIGSLQPPHLKAGIAHIVFGRTETGITVGATGGACPGTIELRSKGLTPNGPFDLYRGTSRGTTVIPSGVCEGFELGLENAVMLARLEADEDGRWFLTTEITSEAACGQRLQVIDLAGCGLSNVTNIPES